MARKRLHRWLKGPTGKPDYCTMCGQDRTPAVEAAGCRPTQLFF